MLDGRRWLRAAWVYHLALGISFGLAAGIAWGVGEGVVVFVLWTAVNLGKDYWYWRKRWRGD
jgi:hypothetical protein